MVSERVLTTARHATGELVAKGARAVVVVGSHARGDARPGSDLDLLAVGEVSYLPRPEGRDGLLVSVSMQTLARHRESFEDPALIPAAVPGWREAVTLADPEGLASLLIAEARRLTWKPRERRCDEWVAEEITLRAESACKLANALEGDHEPIAAAKRSLLTLRLTPALAVHHRILYGSENRLWSPTRWAATGSALRTPLWG